MNDAAPALDVAALRARFPALQQQVNGKRLAYLDNAATTQKPDAVLAAIDGYYRRDNANVHRGVHALSARATTAYEAARDTIAAFFNRPREGVVFTRGTTEAINLVAQSFLRPRLRAGDEILLTLLEHHSNIVPWQLVAAEAGATVRFAPVRDDGSLDLEAWRAMLGDRTRLVAFGHTSNALGTVNPVAEMVGLAKALDIPVLLDAAQATAHAPLDCTALGADFVAVSAHKAWGPMGFGCLLADPARLDAMPPWHGGGDMIETVTVEGSTWNTLPAKFEAGTPDVPGAIGFAAALDLLRETGLGAIAAHEHTLLERAEAGLSDVPGLRIVGTAPGKAAIVSFVMDGAHPQDIGSILDLEGVAIRTGHHCTMPLMAHFGLPATARASFAAYNDFEDVDQLVAAVRKVRDLLA